jgi:thymidylate synthase
MSIIIPGNDCVDAWKNVVNHLFQNNTNEDFNVIVVIYNPLIYDPAWILNNKYNPSSLIQCDSTRKVINTIFPFRLRQYFNNRDDFYFKYKDVYNKGRNKKWGTYFHRLISFGVNEINQIESIIVKLNTWTHYKTPFIFHISSPDTDNLRPRGNPCLQFGEFLWKDNDIIDLVAVYRNHDYFRKAIGNFIALSKLLEFICTETNKTVGKLIIHSIHAYFDVSINNMNTLINR